MKQLLFMPDWPECLPCIWLANGGLWWNAPLSPSLAQRIASWCELWARENDDNDGEWTSQEVRGRWLAQSWDLLGEVNRELVPLGYVVWPGPDFEDAPDALRDGAPTAVRNAVEDLETARAVAVLDQINVELSGRGLSLIPLPR